MTTQPYGSINFTISSGIVLLMPSAQGNRACQTTHRHSTIPLQHASDLYRDVLRDTGKATLHHKLTPTEELWSDPGSDWWPRSRSLRRRLVAGHCCSSRFKRNKVSYFFPGTAILLVVTTRIVASHQSKTPIDSIVAYISRTGGLSV